jgi:hypothetical protein
VACILQADDHDHEEQKQRHVGERGDALTPEMIGAFLGRTKAANAGEGGAHISHDLAP